MIFKQKDPIPKLKDIITSYWLIDSNDDQTIRKEKIIPDGYPELIFHYKDPFKINITGHWQLQDNCLIAGQIRNHFYLENTGSVGIFGIKLQPWALKMLFDLDMTPLVDTVISINTDIKKQLPFISIVRGDSSFEDKVSQVEDYFLKHFAIDSFKASKGQQAIQLIINSKGAKSIQDVLEEVEINERSLERYFKHYIGLSPKFYSRIIRFSNIFNLIQNTQFDWADISFLAGFYDQSHFIKNFKEFTGEEPTKYGFNKENMANFFLKK